MLGPAFRLLKGTRSNYAELEYDFKECYKALLEKLDWENPEGGDYPFDLSKPIPLIKHGKHQRVPFKIFINNDLKYLQGGILTMRYTTSTTKTKAAKVSYIGDNNVSRSMHMQEACNQEEMYILQSVFWQSLMSRKSTFPTTSDQLYLGYVILWLESAQNLSQGHDVDDFAIPKECSTRSLVIQKRVEDLQLGVESYQKKINVTKPDTTRPVLRKRHPYTPYKDPQGFIYVDDYKRNRLMRSDELYKFSDATLTRLLSSFEDITKNIDMEYLPKRRWSNLEKALTEKAQLKEVRKKSLRDFHKTHPSGSGTGAQKPPSVEKITPTVTSKGTSDKPRVPDVTEDDSTKSESESWGNDEDDNNKEQEASDEGSGYENESEVQESDSEQDQESVDDNQEEEEVDQENESEDDEIKIDEDREMNDTTDQFDDDVDAIFEEPTQTGKEVVQGEGADAEMIDAQQGNENLETTQEQVVEDAHVTISTVTKKTEVPATSSSRSSDLASKFLIFLDIPHTDAEIVSPLDVHVHHEVPRTQAPTLLTIPVSVIIESSPVLTNIPQSSQTFTLPPILTTPTPPPTIETTNPLSTLPDFASVFQFKDRITTLEKEVAEIKKDPLHTQVTSLVDEHLDTR
ncbi:hypothetical protein Tco_1003116 [Tanacetum coccineum]|uniref:Uncharacterized protein n=1 Tax=Tanacetum coccineum TaxID=301880 RepID=A0ABQ5F9N2_9ASTR